MAPRPRTPFVYPCVSARVRVHRLPMHVRARMHGQQACMMYIQVVRAKHSTHIGEEHPAQRRSDESTVIAPRLAAPQPEAGLF